MSTYANSVVSHLLAQTWQIALLAGIVGVTSAALRNRSAHLRYLLWMVVLAKCLVPPILTIPLAVLPERSAIPSVALTNVPEEPSAPETSVSARDSARPQAWKPALPGTREAIALGWTAGVFLFLLWVGGRAVRYAAWFRARRQPLPLGLRDSLHDSSLGFRFRKWPQIWLLDEISQPFVWGLLRGSVYLPADFVGGNGSGRQRSILAHELSHIARWDAGVNFLQVLAQAVYWFHPLVWWANRKIRQEREKCCDEMAIAHLHTPPEHYTGAIVDALAAERRSAHPIPSLAIVGSVRDIEERIKTMLKPGKTFRTRPSVVAAAVASLIGLVTIPTALVLTARGQGQPAPQTSAQASTDSEKVEQSRFAARTFNSTLELGVSLVHETPIHASTTIGHTPNPTPLGIPACWLWAVCLKDPVPDWDLLTREISASEVPGLVLESATNSDLEHLGDLTGLQYLDLSGPTITSEGLSHLKGLTRLETFFLHDKISDAGLKYLAALTGLRQLGLFRASITDAGMANLKQLIRLKDLLLFSDQVTDLGLVHLQGLTSLRQLHLSGDKITDAGIERLKALSGLRCLSLHGAQITDAGLVHLKGLTALQHLGLWNTNITDASMERLKELTGLEQLDLRQSRFTDAALEHLKGLPRLKELILANTPITDTSLTHLKDMNRLRSLVLANTRITDAGLEHLSTMTGLRSLVVLRTRVTDAGVRRLQQALPNLTIEKGAGPSGTQGADKRPPSATADALNAQEPEPPRFAARTFNSEIAFDVWVQGEEGNRGERLIGHTPNTTSLEIPACWLWGVRLTGPVNDWDLLKREMGQNKIPGLTLNAVDSDLKQLAGLVEVQSLTLRGSKITDTGTEYLKDMTGLQVLRLDGTPITDVSLEHIKGMTGMQMLSLRGTQITDAGLECLRGMTGLQTLAVNNTGITDSGLEHIKGLTSLRTLNVANTEITDAGLEHIKGMTGLQVLCLGSKQMTDAGLEHIKGMTGLQSLFLYGSSFTDAGLEHIKDAGGLQLLYLGGTSITDAGVQRLKQSLPKLTITR